ncbi:TPA: hypothetical protein N2Z19_003905 [Escherichia coli]|nr:hypothetical protein [Escherichia coli]
MKGQQNWKMLEVRIIEWFLNVLAFGFSIFVTLYSYMGGAYNPLINGLAYVSRKWGSGGVVTPTTFHQYFIEWDRYDFFSVEFYSLIILGMVTVLFLVLTFYFIAVSASMLTAVIEIKYIELRFGKRFLKAYERLEGKLMRKLQSQLIKPATAKDEKNDLKSAAYKHYEEWIKYHKSNLSFDEWKIKVMDEHSDSEVGK